MGSSVRIGRIVGTPISVDAGLAILAALFTATLAVEGFPRVDPEASLSARLVAAVLTVGLFLASTLAHELGHAVVARRHGVGVLGVTLTLFGGYAKLDRQAPTPGAEFAIAAAGPAVNIVIGSALVAITMLITDGAPDRTLLIAGLAWLAGVNLFLAVINLLPASPLDGGRVLTAALWRRLGDAEWARVLSGRAGLLLSVVAAGVGLVQGWFGQWQGAVTLVVAGFLFFGARGEIASAAVRRRLQRTSPAQVMVSSPPSVADSLTAEELVRLAGPERLGVAFPVVRWSTEPIGYVVPDAGADLDGIERNRVTVGDLMQPVGSVPRAWATEAVVDVLGRLTGSDPLVVVVHEPSGGRVVGTITESQLSPLLVEPNLWGRDRDHRSAQGSKRRSIRSDRATSAEVPARSTG